MIDTTVYSDRPAQRRRAEPASSEGASGAGDVQGSDAPKPLSQRLVDELAVERRDILAINLASNPAVAMDYMIFCMATHSRPYGAETLGTSLRASPPPNNVQTYPESPAHTLMLDLRETLDTAWTEHDRTVDRFDAFCELDDDAKAAWLAYCVARTLEPSLGIDRRTGQSGADRNNLHDRLAEIMGVNAASHWRPTAANYFDRVSKQVLLAHLTEVGGATFAASYLSSKKGDLSASCEKIFSGQTIIDAEIKERALAWVPGHMAFNPGSGESPDSSASDGAVKHDAVEHDDAEPGEGEAAELVDA